MTPIEIIRRYATDVTRHEPQLDQLYRFSLREIILEHQRFKSTLKTIAELHYYCLQNKVGKGLIIVGPSGIGKTSMLKYYAGNFPKVMETQVTRIPVLIVTTPSTPTTDSMAEAILLALGDPLASKGNAKDKLNRIKLLFEQCQVELLLIDEFQHFFYARTIVEFRTVTDWLKIFLNETAKAVVLCGLPEAEMVIQSNEQLARRFSSKYTLTPFTFTSDQDFIEFRGVLRAFQEGLPLPVETPLYEANLARRFLIASNGLIDYVRKILEGAVSVATAAGHQSLDLPTYAEGFRREVWADVADRLNPFHQESPLRTLNRSGEPFYASYKRHAIGSPLARRLNMVQKGAKND